MAGIDLAALRTAIKARLDAASIQDANGRKLAVFAYQSENTNLQYPCAIIKHGRGEIDFNVTFGSRGLESLPLAIEVRAQSADGINAEMLLDLFITPGSTASVWDALVYVSGSPEPTFGGLVDSATSITCTSPALFRDEGDPAMPTEYWAVTFALNVYKPKG